MSPRSFVPALALAVAFALALVPPAQAHFEETNLNSGVLKADPFVVSFRTSPATVYQDASTTFSMQVGGPDGTPYRRDEVEVKVTVAGPGPHSESKTAVPDGTGFYITTLAFPATGIYSARIEITLRSTGQQGAATTQVEVFPDLPIRIRPIDLALVVYANRTTTFDFEVVNATLLTRDDRVQELTMRLEHWADDHVRKISEQEIQGERIGMGLWRFLATPDSSGMHHIRFASPSGGFNYAESPPLHAYVDPDLADAPVEEPRQETPTLGVAWVALAVLAVALFLARKR